jgi:hypothetical protein
MPMLRTLLLLGGVFFACPEVSLAQLAAPQTRPTYVKVEVGGTLSVTGIPRKIPELEALRTGPLNASYTNATLITTGVAVATEQLGMVEIYLGEDPNLHKLARDLNGKPVVISGDLRQMVFYPTQPGGTGSPAPAWDMNRQWQVPMGQPWGWGPGGPAWTPVTKTFILVTSIRAADPQ